MKLVGKLVLAAGFAIATGFAAPEKALAQITTSGTLPPATTIVLIQATKQGKLTGLVKFKFSAPQGPSGGYSLGFCIGPAANPCGMRDSYKVDVPGGEERLAIVDASMFVANVLVVGNPTASSLPYTVQME
jgi:hypothetical protein